MCVRVFEREREREMGRKKVLDLGLCATEASTPQVVDCVEEGRGEGGGSV
jgi:hypothetical protein